jgi:predicted Zn-dependent protease
MRCFLVLGIWIFGLTPVGFAAPPDSTIFQAMEEEMARSRTDLKVDTFGPPYFINYQIRHHDRAEVEASFGSLVHSFNSPQRTLYVDVRVGDPQFDSSSPRSHNFSVQQFVPIDNDLDGLKRALWYETDLRYKQAIVSYLKKKGRLISGVERHALPDFSQSEAVIQRMEPVPGWNPDIPTWENMARRVSARFKQAPDIEKSRVKISADRFIRYYYDSEGNQIREASVQYALLIDAWTKTKEGVRLHDQETLYLPAKEDLPSVDSLITRTDQLIASLRQLKQAPRMDPYIGPVIFSPDATAVLFHEAIGHRLEGDRLRTEEDGKTFLKKIGKRILPAFVTVVDNPDLDHFQGVPVIGHYRYDDEGQKSEEVVLVDHGILKSFLLSRTPILGFDKSNGHARGDGIHTPTARMSNFIVRSDHKVSANALKQQLIEEIRRQNKPFGLFVKKIVGGETQTGRRQYQVFKGKPLYLYKVYPDGREELVRGVDFVGTPLAMIGKILVTGNDLTVINGFCTAESGTLPVTSITPSVLLSEVELQSAHQPTVRKPILDPPPVTRIN